MPRRKRLTGKELIRLLKKAGFDVIRIQAAIIDCVMPTAALPLSPSARVKRLAPDCFAKSSKTAI